MSKKTYSELLLSTMRTLLGVIPQELRGVAVELKNDDIILYFYHNGEISPEIDDELTLPRLCTFKEKVAKNGSLG